MKQVMKKFAAVMLLCALVISCIPVTRAEAASLSTKTYDMAIGETLKVAPLILKKSKTATYSYATNKKKIATVSKKGVVTAKAAGKVKITVSETKKSKTKKVGTITITVHEAEVTKWMDEYWFSGQVGIFEKYPSQMDIYEFLSYVNPKATYTWHSDNPEMLTISESGLVTHAGFPTEGSCEVGLSIQETYNGKTRTIDLSQRMYIHVLAPRIPQYWGDTFEDGHLVLSLKVGESFNVNDHLIATSAYGSVWYSEEMTEEKILTYWAEYVAGGDEDGDDSEKALLAVNDEGGSWHGEYKAQKPGTYYMYLVAYNYLTEVCDTYIGSIKVVVTE